MRIDGVWPRMEHTALLQLALVAERGLIDRMFLFPTLVDVYIACYVAA